MKKPHAHDGDVTLTHGGKPLCENKRTLNQVKLQSLFLKHKEIKNKPKLYQLFFWECKQKSETSASKPDPDLFRSIYWSAQHGAK